MTSLRSARTLALTLVALAFLTACGGGSAGSSSKGDGGTSVTEAVLSDGTVCAVMDAQQGKALRCNWHGPKRAFDGTPPQGDGGTTITEVTLSDGTRCAVMDAQQGKALDCDW